MLLAKRKRADFRLLQQKPAQFQNDHPSMTAWGESYVGEPVPNKQKNGAHKDFYVLYSAPMKVRRFVKKHRVTISALTERAWDIPGLSAQERLLLLHLIRISKNGQCSVGIKELADRFDMRSRRMVEIIGGLVDRKLVERHPQIAATGGRLPNIYRIVAMMIMGLALTPVMADASTQQTASERVSYATLPKSRRRRRSVAA